MAVGTEKWLDAQYSVLGSVLIDEKLTPKVIAETSEADFSGACRTVYKVIRRLFMDGTAVDPVSVAHSLGDSYQSFLMQLMTITPTTAYIDNYIALCKAQARLTSVRELAGQIAEAETVDDLRKLLDKANGIMADKPSLRISTMDYALHSFFERHEKDPDYLTWPVPELNDRIYGELGDFFIIAGAPSSGKSAWALQCAWHWAQRYKVGFFSLETSSEKLFDRQMASISGISMDDIKRNKIQDADWEAVCQKSSQITARKLELIPAAGMTPADVRAVAMMRGYQIILVDYLQLLQSSGENRTAQVTNISIALHTMAQSMGITVVALSQLARKKEGQPNMSDLRESGQIEQDADMIMILSLEKKDETDGNRIMKIAKNKEGTCPRILLAFDGKHQTFSKAQNTGEVVQALKAAAKKTLRQAREAAKQEENGQMAMLPSNTPVPFADEKEG